MRRRGGRPGLVGTMARTAVVAGTATAVAGSVSNKQAGRQQAAAPAPPAPAPGVPTGDFMAELSKLAELKAAGVLTDDEFAAAKSKLLA